MSLVRASDAPGWVACALIWLALLLLAGVLYG